MNQARKANIQQHRARPAKPANDRKERESMPEEYKKDYIVFINQLMERMRMDAIRAMLDRALELTEDK